MIPDSLSRKMAYSRTELTSSLNVASSVGVPLLPTPESQFDEPSTSFITLPCCRFRSRSSQGQADVARGPSHLPEHGGATETGWMATVKLLKQSSCLSFGN